MGYSAPSIITSLPREMRGTITYSGTTAKAGRASISKETALTMYGDAIEYAASFYLDSADWGTLPSGNETIVATMPDATVTYLVLGLQTAPGNHRRLDVGSVNAP